MKYDHSDALEQIASDTGRSPLEVLELFLERAAIREYDAGFERTHVEHLALGDAAEVLGLPQDAVLQLVDAIGCDEQVCRRRESSAFECTASRSEQPSGGAL